MLYYQRGSWTLLKWGWRPKVDHQDLYIVHDLEVKVSIPLVQEKKHIQQKVGTQLWFCRDLHPLEQPQPQLGGPLLPACCPSEPTRLIWLNDVISEGEIFEGRTSKLSHQKSLCRFFLKNFPPEGSLSQWPIELRWACKWSRRWPATEVAAPGVIQLSNV